MAIETPDEPATSDEPDPGHVLTWRQRKVLQVIRAAIRERGYPPSMQEIGDAVGLTSQSSVSYQIALLEKKGYLRRDGRRPRTVEVRLPGHPPVRPVSPDRRDGTGPLGPGFDIPSQEAARVPLVDRVRASGPVVAGEQVRAIMPLPRKLVGHGALFMFAMQGDSMINAAIADGDWVVVRERAQALDGDNSDEDSLDGDIVAAIISGEATVRTYKRGGDGRVWLVPNNPDYTPAAGHTATILGKVVAIIRRLEAI